MDRAARKKMLDSKKAELAAAIDAVAITRELVERDVISEGILDLILKLKNNKEKTYKLVDALKISKSDRFEIFCDVLCQHGNEKLANELMQRDNDQNKIKRKNRSAAGKHKGLNPEGGDIILN